MTDDYSAGQAMAPEGAPVRPGYVMPRRPQVREPMDDDRFQAIVHEVIADAEAYADETLAPERDQAANYYYARPLGNEVPGRSSIVMSEVRDVVNMMMPGLMRVFAGNQQVVEFDPMSEEDVENAKQATDYLDYVFMRDNPGFRIIYDAASDGLVRSLGVFKWHWEKSAEVIEENYDGLSLGEAMMLSQDPDIEVIEVIQT
jgi:hypothetical protein